MEAEIASKCKSVVIIGSLRQAGLAWVAQSSCDHDGKLRENYHRDSLASHSSPFVRNVTKQRGGGPGPTTNTEKFYLTDFILDIYPTILCTTTSIPIDSLIGKNVRPSEIETYQTALNNAEEGTLCCST